MKVITGAMRHAMLIAALLAGAAGLGGCATTEPLASEHLQEEIRDPHVSIVLFRFKAPRLPPDRGFLGLVNRNDLPWIFAVANESTGWNFRRLDPFSMVFHTSEDTMEPDPSGTASGWVTFLAPQGLSYIAVLNITPAQEDSLGWDSKPRPDHISVVRSKDQDKSGVLMMDFIDAPRFAVQINDPQSLIYAGTIVRNNECGTEVRLPACPYDLTVADETGLAQQFVNRYQKGFAGAAPMRTQLLSIPQTRTIKIRSRPAVPGSLDP